MDEHAKLWAQFCDEQGFMRAQVKQADFYLVETVMGTELVPEDVIGSVTPSAFLHEATLTDGEGFDLMCDRIRPYIESWRPITSIERRQGWVGRLSANGFMGCTDWTHGATEREVQEDLMRMYGDD